jgi:hypothetical protein
MANVQGSLVDGSYALITSNKRNIGGIIPNVVIEEVGTDILRISDHPVEVGATVSDHAFKLPCEITLRCGWSDSSGGFEGYSASVYSMLLQLQTARTPFTLSTGKRLYQNMLIGRVEQCPVVRRDLDVSADARKCCATPTVACHFQVVRQAFLGQCRARVASVPSASVPPRGVLMGS